MLKAVSERADIFCSNFSLFLAAAFSERAGGAAAFFIRNNGAVLVFGSNGVYFMQTMTRTFLNTKTAFDTFAVVDNRQTAVGIFAHGNSLHRADFCAHAAADAGNAAVYNSGFPFVAVIAF